jgi:hypothetical protein
LDLPSGRTVPRQERSESERTISIPRTGGG